MWPLYDRRTASADVYPSLIPSLPHSTTVEQPAAPFYPTPHSLAEDGIEDIGTRRLEIDPHARVLRARLELPVPVLSDLLGPTPQSSDDTRIADLTTAHHNFIPIKHRSYPNTVNYYLDSTNYCLTKTKTDKLTQRLAEFSYMLAFTRYSFTSRLLCTNQPSFHPPPPTCIVHPGAVLLHDYWTVYDSPPDLPFVCYTPSNIRNNNIV